MKYKLAEIKRPATSRPILEKFFILIPNLLLCRGARKPYRAVPTFEREGDFRLAADAARGNTTLA
jgi:hypothetical protein